MRAHLPHVAGVVLGGLPVAWGQTNDPLSDIISQAFSVFTDVKSFLSEEATATRASATSTSASSSSTSTSSEASSTTSSTFSTSSTASTGSSTQSASNTAEAAAASSSAAAASSSAAAAVAAAHAQNGKSRTTAIVVGVVLGLLALLALIGLLLFCLRRRRRRRAVKSRRSLSPEAVDGAPWGKERLSTSSTAGHATPGRRSTNERHHTPVGAAAPFMAEKALNRHSGHDAPGGSAPGNSAPVPHQSAPNFQPGLMDGSAAGHQPHQAGHNHIPLSSHSRSGPATAGLGVAALGGLAAKHHHDKHEEQDSAHHQPNAHRHSLGRKPVGGALGHGTTGHSPNTDAAKDIAPGYQTHHSGLPSGDMKNSSEPLGTNGGTNSGPPLKSGNPPAYSGTGHPLSSHPPFDDSHRHSTGNHEPLMAGVAGVGAGALGAATLAKHHDRGRTQDSPPTGRRSWDPNRRPQHPQSILANSNGRRSTGSTNPYVQARSPRRARFSDDVAGVEDDAHTGHGKHDAMPQDSPYPRMDHHESQRLISPISDDAPSHPPPRPSMPGGWRGSGEFDRDSPRGSFSNDSPVAGPAQSWKHRNPSLSDLRRQEEDGPYRGRHVGGDEGVRAAAAPDRPGYDQRFYASNREVGQAV
jgi:hypothetical protein